MNFVPEVVDASLPKVGEHIGAWLSITFSHQVTVDTDNINPFFTAFSPENFLLKGLKGYPPFEQNPQEVFDTPPTGV